MRDGKSSDAAVIPSCGWIKVQKHSQPVLQQEACDARQPGQECATAQVTNSVLQRLGVMMPKPDEERLMFAVSHRGSHGSLGAWDPSSTPVTCFFLNDIASCAFL